MPKNYILVDTNIWQFALAKPKENELTELHELARSFLSSVMEDESVRIAISTYQIGEIIEVLRKTGVPVEDRSIILDDFRKPKFYVRDLSIDDVFSAVRHSSESNIHVYDYLVVYPLRDIIYAIYSADRHLLMGEDFTSLCEVTNPLAPWIQTEGKKPERRTNTAKSQT